jgi:hypothetical protein
MGSTRRRALLCTTACLRETCGAHLCEKGGREEAALVAAMRSQRRRDPREGENDVRGGGLGGAWAAATVVCGISSSRTSSEARFGLRSSSRLWSIFRMPSAVRGWEEPT